MADKQDSGDSAIHQDLEGILERASAGDQSALAETFAQYRTLLKKSVAARMDRRLRSRIDESDIVQDAYLDATRRLAEFSKQRDRMPVLLWIRLLASQRLVDLHRQHLGAGMRDLSMEISLDRATGQSSSLWLAERLVDSQASASQVAMRAELLQEVRDALERLDPLDREVLAMRHFEQLCNAEVAMMLGITTTASSNRYIRALRRLEKLLQPAAGEAARGNRQ